MKTKTIFKALALAMLMPAMLLTTACSNEDDAINNGDNKKGYPLQVTVNVTRQGDKATTRAEYNESTHKLEFSTGDKLLVTGYYGSNYYSFAGTLDWVSDRTFSGTITTENGWGGTALELLEAAASPSACLLPAGYDAPYSFLSINNPGTCNASVGYNYKNAFATSKSAAVAQFSYEKGDYTSGTGFELHPLSAILNFTITGLTPNTNVTASLEEESGGELVSGAVTTDGDGTATFAMGVKYGNKNALTLTIGGTDIDITDASKTLEAGKIYNIARSATGTLINLANVTENTEAQNGDILTGTLGEDVKISIADGATVILNGVSINATGDWDSDEHAGITCLGNATIILSGTNTVKGFYEDYPGIYVPVDKTVTIKGSGSLTASSNNGYGAGIGGGLNIACGNIEIQGGTITATGGFGAAGIGSGKDASCGNITISGGNVTAISESDAAAIGISPYSTCTCTSVTITPGITRLTLTNSNSEVLSYVSDFIYAEAVYANTTPITTSMLDMSVTHSLIIAGMTSAGFATSYNDGTQTWTITKN